MGRREVGAREYQFKCASQGSCLTNKEACTGCIEHHVEKAIAIARAEGYRAGIEAAIKAVRERWGNDGCSFLIDAIRATTTNGDGE